MDVNTISLIPQRLLLHLKANTSLSELFSKINADRFTQMMSKIINMSLGSYTAVDLNAIVFTHRRFVIGEQERIEWSKCLDDTFVELRIDYEVRSKIIVFMSDFFQCIKRSQSVMPRNHSF